MSKKLFSVRRATGLEGAFPLARRLAGSWARLRHSFRKVALFVELFVTKSGGFARR